MPGTKSYSRGTMFFFMLHQKQYFWYRLCNCFNLRLQFLVPDDISYSDFIKTEFMWCSFNLVFFCVSCSMLYPLHSYLPLYDLLLQEASQLCSTGATFFRAPCIGSHTIDFLNHMTGPGRVPFLLRTISLFWRCTWTSWVPCAAAYSGILPTTCMFHFFAADVIAFLFSPYHIIAFFFDYIGSYFPYYLSVVHLLNGCDRTY